jgi:serine-type D-Ala-D-Ala carboxypeptidase/endopeptidase (penicillin-binding protein 4)
MKYLGDSLVGALVTQNDSALYVIATGDPSFLHPDFQSQPLYDLLKKTHKKIFLDDGGWREIALGPGWSWDDLSDDYSVERSPFPIYGNFIRWTQQKNLSTANAGFSGGATAFSYPDNPWKAHFGKDTSSTFVIKRALDSNIFTIWTGHETSAQLDVPFVTDTLAAALQLLPDTLGKKVYRAHVLIGPPPQPFYSRPADSVFMPMMYHSDNFFAEQTLLMASAKKFMYMKESVIIDTLLNGPLADLPQKPHWVDGSGLSRYNLFTPQDFVSLLIKFKNEFGMDRMKRILPTGGSGTLKNYYKSDSGRIFMKTGSMTGVICLSGYLYTHKNHLLEFSILVNNHLEGGAAIRREVENYVEYLIRNN